MGKQEAQQEAISNTALGCACGPFPSPDGLVSYGESHPCAVGPEEAFVLLMSKTDAARMVGPFPSYPLGHLPGMRVVCGKGPASSFTAVLVNRITAVLPFMENTTLRGESSGDTLDEDACISPVRQLEGQQVPRLHVPRCPSLCGEPVYLGSLCKQIGKRPRELVQ